MNEARRGFSDEINLITTFSVLWKRKGLIILIVILCAIITIFLGIHRPTIYLIDLVMSLSTINKDGKIVHLQPLPVLKRSFVEGGALYNKILLYFSSINKYYSPTLLDIQIEPNLNKLNIYYETKDKDLGIKVLNRIGELIIEEQENNIKEKLQMYEDIIVEKGDLLSDMKFERKLAVTSISRMKSLENTFNEAIESLNRNTNIMVETTKELTKRNVKNDPVVSIYADIIEQNLLLLNALESEIPVYISKIGISEADLMKLNREIQRLTVEIAKLEDERNSIKAPEVEQSAVASVKAAGWNAKRNVVLSMLAGLFLGVWLAFFLEYASKNKDEKRGEIAVSNG